MTKPERPMYRAFGFVHWSFCAPLGYSIRQETQAMAKITPPKDIKIAALSKKKSQAVDIMEGGGGTPWEDRGSVGTLKAFLVTCLMSMRNPGRLVGSIRFVETTGEALRFTIGCGVMWGIGIMLTGLISLTYVASRPRAIIDIPVFAMQYGALTIGMMGAIVLLTWVAARMMHSLLGAEVKTKIPLSLTTNILAYCLGPSLLAVVPFVGPVAAAIGILVALILGFRRRLQVTTKGAATCSVMTLGAMALIVVVVWTIWWVAGWQQWYKIEPPPPPTQIRTRA